MSLIWNKIHLTPNVDVSEWSIILEYTANGLIFSDNTQWQVEVSLQNSL
jgi:hypothetical protein